MSATSEVEDRMGIHSLDALLQKRALLIEQVAPLRAKYGSFGTWDALRKIELSKVEAILRGQEPTKGKWTEGALNTYSHADERYATFVTDATNERATWVVLEAKIEAIDETIMRENAICRYLASEAMLSR
jgi:hypothetical protein